MIPKSFLGIIGMILLLALFVSSYLGNDIEVNTPVTDIEQIPQGDLGILGTAGLLATIVPNVLGTLVGALASLIIVFAMLPVQFQIVVTFIILAGIIGFIKVIWSGETQP